MGLTEICVCFVITLLVWIVSFLWGKFLSLVYNWEDEDGLIFSTMVLAIALGICLTYILFEKGMI